MSQNADQFPVRKLCSCNAVLCSPEESATAPDTALFGVILLNSPANTAYDFEEYIRLYQHYRGSVTDTNAAPQPEAANAQNSTNAKKNSDAATSPYFICADGAYAALKRYCASRYANASAENVQDSHEEDASDAGAFMAMRLCDVLIGDMDSLSSAQLRHVAAVAGAAADVKASSPTTHNGAVEPLPTSDVSAQTAATTEEEEEKIPLYHETVSTVPVALLEVIRRRRAEALQHRHDPSAHRADTPVVLPITCQMSTDFHKCVALLERLQRLEDGNTATLTEEEQAAYYQQRQTEADTRELTTLCRAQVERACEEAARQAGDDADEAARCRRLLTEMSASDNTTTVQTRVLPNVAVLGALGGRIDHEVGAMVCVLRFAQIFHLVVINAYNVLFACWPDGVTQVVMPPSWTQQSNLSKDPEAQLTAPQHQEPYMCGVVPFGTLREMETTGCLWNVVKNRADRYDGFTQTEGYRFAFDGLVSVCNVVSSCIVTVDVRPLQTDKAAPSYDRDAPSANPPTLFMLGRPKASRKVSA